MRTGQSSLARMEGRGQKQGAQEDASAGPGVRCKGWTGRNGKEKINEGSNKEESRSG